MSTPRRPEGEYQGAPHEGSGMTALRRPVGDYLSARHEGQA